MIRNTLVFWVLIIGPVWAQPVVPGLSHERHGLDAAGQGRVLIEELRCAGCHSGPVKRKLGPDLSGVGARVEAGYLKRFLLDPHKADSGTQMPDILGMLPEDEQDATAEVLTYYLKSLSKEKFSRAHRQGAKAGARPVRHGQHQGPRAGNQYIAPRPRRCQGIVTETEPAQRQIRMGNSL